MLDLVASYAFTERKSISNRSRMRQGLVGQCAYEKKRILLTNVPGDYITIRSALGEAAPLNIIVLPVLFEQEVKAVIELASFSRFSETHQSFLDQLTESIGIVLNTIAANMRTEGLLKQSQLLTSELQSQQEELKKTNDRLEQQAARCGARKSCSARSRSAAADQRGAGREGAASRDPEARGRDQEPRGLGRQEAPWRRRPSSSR